jgi:DUF1009 family protein
MTQPIGIIAGGGNLPIATAHGIRAAGRQVACVGLRDCFDPTMRGESDIFATAGIIQLGRWIRLLKRWDVKEAIMVGRVAKVRMYAPFRMLRQLPDWRAAKIWFVRLKNDRRDDALLGAVATELLESGITLIDSTRYIPELMADQGVMTRTKPTSSQMADIEFALPMIKALGQMDIGQSLAVKERAITAVEAMEGTDLMIRRAGGLCPRGNWTLVKVSRPNQDLRFDVPTVGLQTIENLKAAGGSCLAVEAGKTILLDKPRMLEAADQAGISVVGIQVH